MSHSKYTPSEEHGTVDSDDCSQPCGLCSPSLSPELLRQVPPLSLNFSMTTPSIPPLSTHTGGNIFHPDMGLKRFTYLPLLIVCMLQFITLPLFLAPPPLSFSYIRPPLPSGSYTLEVWSNRDILEDMHPREVTYTMPR